MSLRRLLHYPLVLQLSHPLAVVCVAGALAVLAAVFTFGNLGFQTSQRALMHHDARLLQRLAVADRFSDLDAFVVAIENRDTQETIRFVKGLVTRLEADRDNFAQVFARVDPARFRPWALLYLKEEDILKLRDNLQEYNGIIRRIAQSPDLATFFESVNSMITTTMVAELFTGFLDEDPAKGREPVKLDFLISTLGQMKERMDGPARFVSPWRSFFVNEDWKSEAEEGYFWTENRKYLLVLVSPVLKGSGFSQAEQALASLRQAVAATKEEFPEIDAGVTGQKALDEDQKSEALKDAGLATVLSVVGLAVLLGLFWRGIRRPLLMITALIVALSLTFGFTTLLIGHLNILSVAFAPMLLGLGIDYGIHWFARYNEEQQRLGCPAPEALQATMDSVGPPIVLAGISASLSFFPLALTGFKGLAELGISCAIGMILAMLVTLCLVPALIMLCECRPGSVQASAPPGEGRTKPLVNITLPKALLLLGLSAAASGAALWAAGKVRFDLNLLQLQSKNAESVVWEEKLIRGSKHPSIYGVIFAHSREEVKKKTSALKGFATISDVQSIDTVLPSDQQKKIRLLREMRPLLTGVTSISPPSGPVDIDRIDSALSRIRFKMLDTTPTEGDMEKRVESQMRQVRLLIDAIRDRFRSAERDGLRNTLKAFERTLMSDLNDKLAILAQNMDTRPMQVSDLPKPLTDRFVGPGDLYLMRVFPSQNVWEPRFLGPFVRDLRSVDPEAVGDPVMLHVTTNAFRGASIHAALYAVAFICAFLVVTLRSVVATIAAFAPFLVGTLWTFGLMGLLGINLNLANSIFLPLVVGAGVEYGVIVVGRWRETRDGVFNLPVTTGTGVILAGLSTTVGFGSLMISSHRGIHSLGVLAAVGSLTVLAAALFFLPSLLRVVSGKKGPDAPPKRPVRKEEDL